VVENHQVDDGDVILPGLVGRHYRDGAERRRLEGRGPCSAIDGQPSPFFELFARHTPSIPAPRDAFAFAKLRAPRTPAFDAAPGIDAPKWLGRMPLLSEADVAGIDAEYRKRAQSVTFRRAGDTGRSASRAIGTGSPRPSVQGYSVISLR
jgi:hypothetical protein